MKKRGIAIACLAAVALLLFVGAFAQAAQQGDAEEQAISKEQAEAQAQAQVEQEIQKQLGELDFSAWQQQLNRDEEGEQNVDIGDWVAKLARGEAAVQPQDVLDLLAASFTGQAKGFFGLLLSILALSLLSSLLTNLQSNFSAEGVSSFATYAFLLMLTTVIVQMLSIAIGIAGDAIGAMVGLMQTIFPLLLGLLTALGSVSAVGIFQPAMVMLTSMASTTVSKVIFPLTLLSGTLGAIGGFSERIQIKRFGELLGSAIKWSLGILFTVFLGITAIQGLSSASFDGISVRTAKFAVDKGVPIIGGYVSDTMDMLLGCSVIVKNAVGVAGLLSLCGVVLAPLIQLLALSFLLKLCAAIIQPVCEERICNCLASAAQTLTLVFAVVLTVSALFFITVAVMLGAGNVNMMMR